MFPVALGLALANVYAWQDVNTAHFNKNEDISSYPQYSQYKIIGKPRVLKPEFYSNMYTLAQQVLKLCADHKIQVWCSGGTLLGLVRHNELMRFDDDIDLHTDVRHKSLLFSPEFVKSALSYDLQVFVLRGTTVKHASREGAAIRFHLKSHKVPTLDLFFVMSDNTNHICKIDSWKNTDEYVVSKIERWPESSIFPIKSVTVDETYIFPIPNEPKTVLKKQYGDNVLTEVRSRSVWFSHRYAFLMLPYAWVYL